MNYDTLQWLSNEAVLHDFLALLSKPSLLLIIVVCIAVLSFGADWMVDGVISLAVKTGMPTILIGATVVSLGTTMPEAFVSVIAAYKGNPGLALGNGVGSIIANTGLIFGLTCFLVAVPVNRYILNRAGWVQIGAATLLVVIAIQALSVTPPESTPTLERWVGYLSTICFDCLTIIWAGTVMEPACSILPLKFCWGTAGLDGEWRYNRIRCYATKSGING
jgi:cation:H+ antiporter